MARFNLNIDYPVEKMELSQRWIKARAEFRYVDRAPIQYGLWGRYFAPLFNLRYIDFFNDVETQYWWLLEYPEACHRFLEKIMLAEIASEENTRRIDPRPRTFFAIAEDSAQIMSADLFKQFCVPYDEILFRRFGDEIPFGRTIHMCGDSAHLHRTLKEDLKMTYPMPQKPCMIL